MASSNVSRTLVKSLKGRSFSAAAAQADRAQTDSSPKCSVKKLSNGVSVGVIPSNSPVARVAVVANAGSRFESGDNLGISHFLRMSTRIRTENMTSLNVTRTIQQLGGDITIMGTREYIYFKSSVTRNSADKAIKILQELTTKQSYKPWEFTNVQNDHNGMALDLALYETRHDVRAMELLHSAAFRNTLGNSLYAPEHMIGAYSPEQVMQYVKTYFSGGRLALVGIGVDGGLLEELASTFEPYASSGVPVEKASYYGGGENRENTGGEVSYVAVGFGGPSLASKDLLASEVLRRIVGTGPHVKYSSGTIGAHMAKAVAGAVDAPFHVSAMNANYSDNGLFGFTAVAHSSNIEKVLQTAGNQFKGLLSGSIKDHDVTKGKNQLKSEICMQFENPEVLLNWLGEQAMSSDQVISPEDIYKMVDNISTNDVKTAAKGILNTKPSMAATGNIANVPYLDKLFS